MERAGEAAVSEGMENLLRKDPLLSNFGTALQWNIILMLVVLFSYVDSVPKKSYCDKSHGSTIPGSSGSLSGEGQSRAALSSLPSQRKLTAISPLLLMQKVCNPPPQPKKKKKNPTLKLSGEKELLC